MAKKKPRSHIKLSLQGWDKDRKSVGIATVFMTTEDAVEQCKIPPMEAVATTWEPEDVKRVTRAMYIIDANYKQAEFAAWMQNYHNPSN